MTIESKVAWCPPPGDARAAKYGVSSGRARPASGGDQGHAHDAAHAQPLDVLAAEEIGSIIAALEAVDRDLRERGPGRTKSLLEHKARLGRELRAWLREFGGTARSRAEFARELAEGGLAGEIRRRIAEADG